MFLGCESTLSLMCHLLFKMFCIKDLEIWNIEEPKFEKKSIQKKKLSKWFENRILFSQPLASTTSILLITLLNWYLNYLKLNRSFGIDFVTHICIYYSNLRLWNVYINWLSFGTYQRKYSISSHSAIFHCRIIHCALIKWNFLG